MNTNLKNPIRLKNLSYSDVCTNLSHVCFGNYHLPTASDESFAVNNEHAFLIWKQKMMLKYPNAHIEFNPRGHWFERIKIVDQSYQYDKAIYVNSKYQFTNTKGVI